MDWIYFSPHLDDVALSCGGLIWEQVQAGHRVTILTICSGDPPSGGLSPFAQSLHDRWETGAEAMKERRKEDARACTLMGASYRHLGVPDCIYRRGGPLNQPLYASEEALFSPIHPDEASLLEKLRRKLAREIPPRTHIVSPLGLGGHVDHRLTKAAVEGMVFTGSNNGKRLLRYYQDYPYAQQKNDWPDHRQESGWEAVTYPISQEGLRAWGDAVAAHRSQISTFWPNLEAMREALKRYAQRDAGIRLWRRG